MPVPASERLPPRRVHALQGCAGRVCSLQGGRSLPLHPGPRTHALGTQTLCLSPGGKALPNTRAPSLAKGYGSTSLIPPCPKSLIPDCEERSCPFWAGCADLCLSGQFDGTHIVSGSLDTSIRVWDVESGNCLHTLMGHQSLTSGMELRDNILVSGNADSTVKIWDIKTGQCLQTLQGACGRMECPTR